MDRPTMNAATLRRLAAESNELGKISYYLQAFELEKDADTAMQLAGIYTNGRLYHGGGDYIEHFRTLHPYFSEVVALVSQSNAAAQQFTQALRAMLTNMYHDTLTYEIDLVNSRFFLYLYNDIEEFLYEALPACRERIASNAEFAHIELMTIKLLHIVLYKIFTGRVQDRHGTGSYTTGYTATRESFGNYSIKAEKEVYSSTTSALNALGLADKTEEYKLILNRLRAEIRQRDPQYQFMDKETNTENNIYFEGFPGSQVTAKVNTDLKSTFRRVRYGSILLKIVLTGLITGLFMLYFVPGLANLELWRKILLYAVGFCPAVIALPLLWNQWRKAVAYTRHIRISNRL